MRILANRFVLASAEPRKGGMAEIHRAVDQQNNLAPVAVKFMTATRIQDDRYVREAFQRELRALSTLDHPNIVKIIDFEPHDKDGNPPYLVLEWLDRDLTKYLETSAPVDWNDFYERIGRPVLDALTYASTQRLTHRDLKPGNILMDDAGTPKVADFGISKFWSDNSAPGQTLGVFKSEPYAPFDEHPGFDSRDPYSFAVLVLRCIGNKDLTTHEDVAVALENFVGPSAIHAVLRRALHRQPSERFRNIVELQNAVEVAKASLQEPDSAPVCYLFFSPHVLGRLCERLCDSDDRKIRRRLEQELIESCSFAFWRDKDGKKQETTFHARTPHFRLHLKIDDRSHDHLVLLNAWPEESDRHDVYGDLNFTAPMRLRFGRPPPGFDGILTIKWLLESVQEHEHAQADARRSRAGEEILREWANTLRFRQYLEETRHAPIDYDEYEVRGNRIAFRIASLPPGVALEQARQIRREHRSVLSGVIEGISSDRVVLWVERGITENPPAKGQLVIDDHASRIAIDRQKAALDAVRYHRCLRPVLRTIILDPAQARHPKIVERVEWAQSDFDEDKKAAVRAALGTEDILVVHGPPGTGKTRFITELIAQFLQRDADCKILLTSQTHVALDNALERLHNLRKTARLLRIAQRDDDRVSPQVRDLTIDAVATRWTAELTKASEKFLESMAADLGVKREDIALGIAAGRLRVESAALDEVETQLAECERLLAIAEQQLAAAEIAQVADAYHETTEQLDELREQARELRERKKTVGARRREAARALAAIGELGQQLADANTAELAEWETGLLAGSESDRKFLTLIRLAEEWQLRFGSSREFYATMVADASVVAGTCLGFARIPGMLAAEFDVCIVDEASKATATELLVPLSRAKRWILVGDPKQLPPFVEDLLDDKQLLRQYELDRDSFQTTLLDRFVRALPAACTATLKTQHRMIRPIGNLISECFYDGALNSVRDERDDQLRMVMPSPVTWITTAGAPTHDETDSKGTFKNITEARIIGDWLKRLDFIAKTAGKKYRVGVVSGYFGQTAELQRVVAALHRDISALTIECNTVDAFQGRETDICVYSVTRCNSRGVIGFLRDERRMNVALSRGRSGLLIVGDHHFCRTARSPNPLRRVVEYIENHPGDCSIKEWNT